MAAYNAEPFQKRAGSRASVFAAEEKPLLRPLPAVPYEISRWVYGRRVAKNGHITFGKNFYSVPYTHVGAKVDLRLTDTLLEVFRGHERLASHLLAPANVVNEYRTHDADLPAGPGYRQWDSDLTRATGLSLRRIIKTLQLLREGLVEINGTLATIPAALTPEAKEILRTLPEKLGH